MTDARTVTAQLQSFKTFRLSLKGSVVLPDDAKYDELRTPRLEVIDQRPAMIVDAECAEDVVASVNFASTDFREASWRPATALPHAATACSCVSRR